MFKRLLVATPPALILAALAAAEAYAAAAAARPATGRGAADMRGPVRIQDLLRLGVIAGMHIAATVASARGHRSAAERLWRHACG